MKIKNIYVVPTTIFDQEDILFVKKLKQPKYDLQGNIVNCKDALTKQNAFFPLHKMIPISAFMTVEEKCEEMDDKGLQSFCQSKYPEIRERLQKEKRPIGFRRW